LATRLDRLRENAGLSQAQLAERAGLHPLTVQAIEGGRRKTRSRPGTMKAIADVLGVRVHDVWEFGHRRTANGRARRARAEGARV
jgi:transcriptional regulator with XRE-family HTH domain